MSLMLYSRKFASMPKPIKSAINLPTNCWSKALKVWKADKAFCVCDGRGWFLEFIRDLVYFVTFLRVIKELFFSDSI